MSEPQKKSEGKIIKLQKEKGYGFIISREHPFTKFFFHWTGLIPTTQFMDLEEKQIVMFIPIIPVNNETGEDGKLKGPRAVQIERKM